jgi:hypothetical protein
VRCRFRSALAEAANGLKSIEGAVLPRSTNIGFRHHNRDAFYALVTYYVCRNHIHSFEPALFSTRFQVKWPENNLVQLGRELATAQIAVGANG